MLTTEAHLLGEKCSNTKESSQFNWKKMTPEETEIIQELAKPLSLPQIKIASSEKFEKMIASLNK